MNYILRTWNGEIISRSCVFCGPQPKVSIDIILCLQDHHLLNTNQNVLMQFSSAQPFDHQPQATMASPTLSSISYVHNLKPVSLVAQPYIILLGFPDSKAQGADRTQVGSMLAPWTLLSGLSCISIHRQKERCIVPLTFYKLMCLTYQIFLSCF